MCWASVAMQRQRIDDIGQVAAQSPASASAGPADASSTHVPDQHFAPAETDPADLQVTSASDIEPPSKKPLTAKTVGGARKKKGKGKDRNKVGNQR